MRAVLLAVLALSGCDKAAKLISAPVNTTDAPSATTRWVETRPAADTSLLEAPARVLASPDSAASVSPPLQARIVRVRVRAGQQVTAGEALIDVLMPDLLHAAGDLAGEQIKIEAYSKRKTQLEGLKAEGLVRLAELAEVEAQLSTARADAQAARATLRAAGVGDRQAEGLLTGDGVLSLRAPISGLVTNVDAVHGEVREPSGRVLVQLAGVGEGRVEARLPSLPADGAHFTFSTGSAVVPVELLSISPRFELSDGSRLAWFTAGADGGVLPIGAAGRLRLLGDVSWRVVPSRAIDEVGAVAQVRVKTASGAAVVPVKVVARSGAEAVVVGLSADALVAAEFSEQP